MSAKFPVAAIIVVLTFSAVMPENLFAQQGTSSMSFNATRAGAISGAGSRGFYGQPMPDPDSILMLEPAVTKALAAIEDEVEWLANPPNR